MAHTRTVHACDHCILYRRAKLKAVVEHETHCFKNPSRTPWVGELTWARSEGRIVNYGPGEGLREDESWFEWVPYDKMPGWWPGPGKIWTGTAWVDVPGYRREPAKPGHGCAGGAPDEEIWPIIDGIPLSSIPASGRLVVLDKTDEGGSK